MIGMGGALKSKWLKKFTDGLFQHQDGNLDRIRTLWLREMMHLRKERSRWLGVVGQPLLFWLILGSGMAGTFQIADAGGVSYKEYFYPGILIMIVLFTAIFSTISIIEDRQSGFLQSVLVAPGSQIALVLGKIAGVATLILIQSALFLLLAPMAGYRYGDISWLMLFVTILLGCVGLTSIGFAMAWKINSTQGYHAVMSVALIPLWIVSGAMFPPAGSWLGVIMTLNPMTYMVSGARHALNGAGAGGPGPVTSLLVLAVFALIALKVAVRACAPRRAAGRQGNGD